MLGLSRFKFFFQYSSLCFIPHKTFFKFNQINLILRQTFSLSIEKPMDLKVIVKRLQEFAPLNISCDWDNVGLLVEPSDPLLVKRILLTNDLTEPVLEEALKENANLIVSYHPAIFKPYLKSLTQKSWKERSIVKCIEHRIAVYCPHTSWDSLDGGINDWILSAFNTKKIENVEDIISPVHPCGFSKNVKIQTNFGQQKEFLLDKIKANTCFSFVGEKEVLGKNSTKQTELEFLTSPKGLVDFIETVSENFSDKESVLSSLRIFDMDKPLMKNTGLGRIGYLDGALKIKEVVDILKEHFKMKTFRVALGNGKTLESIIGTIAVGAGSASKLLNDVKADLIVTGEFAHHEILHEVHNGTTLVLTDHSNCERGYQELFKKNFLSLLQKHNENTDIIISKVDRDPLEYI